LKIKLRHGRIILFTLKGRSCIYVVKGIFIFKKEVLQYLSAIKYIYDAFRAQDFSSHQKK
jgi:hypothetical protein